MKYRDIECTIAQGVGRHAWTWSTTTVAGVMVMGRAHTKAAAIAAAEKTIDKALNVKKVRLVLPKTPS